MSDTTVRDQVGLTISAYRRNAEVAWDEDLMLADHLLEQGWRPPARVVSTVEELDALAPNTAIRSALGTVMEKWQDGQWRPTGMHNTWPRVELPATVIYEPKEGSE